VSDILGETTQSFFFYKWAPKGFRSIKRPATAVNVTFKKAGRRVIPKNIGRLNSRKVKTFKKTQ